MIFLYEILFIVVVSSTQIPSNTIKCVVCRSILFCIAKYAAKIYQVASKHALHTRALIHIDHHKHALANGNCRESMQVFKFTIRSQVKLTPFSSPNAISLYDAQQIIIDKVIRPEETNG